MTNRKNNNSILFLTTLGVYLGLVLVGATPVLGHAALTRNFELQDEIEVKDDLDKKPDDDRSSVLESVQVYLEDVEFFLRNLQNLHRKGNFDPAVDFFEVEQATMLPCVARNTVGDYTPTKFVNNNAFSRQALERFSKLLTDGYSLGDCLPNDKFSGVEATNSNFVFKFDGSELSVEVTVKKQSPYIADKLRRQLENALKLFAANEKDAVRLKVLSSTAFRSVNDQVFVITRLPRASIDSLLATDAK